jgi:heat shock protein HslJ
MRIARASTAVFLFLCGICLHADEANPQKVTITGTLGRVMAIGAESTGWSVQVSSDTVIDGKPISAIEVSDTRKPKQLEEFDHKLVKISGKVMYRHGVETGVQPYVEILSIKEIADTHAHALPFNIFGTSWSLEDMGGKPMSDSAHPTLTFPEAGKVAGNGSCNRFFGPATISGDHITLGPLASSRMACPEPVMSEETAYLQALQAADRVEWQKPYLLIHSRGMENPLRFSRVDDTKPTAP